MRDDTLCSVCKLVSGAIRDFIEKNLTKVQWLSRIAATVPDCSCIYTCIPYHNPLLTPSNCMCSRKSGTVIGNAMYERMNVHVHACTLELPLFSGFQK